MPTSGTTLSRWHRAEALLRAVVGIEDAFVWHSPAPVAAAPRPAAARRAGAATPAVEPAPAGAAVLAVSVLPAPGTATRQVVRNVVSALFAGFGMRPASEDIRIVTAAEIAAARAHRAASEPGDRQAPAAVQQEATAAAAERPAPPDANRTMAARPELAVLDGHASRPHSSGAHTTGGYAGNGNGAHGGNGRRPHDLHASPAPLPPLAAPVLPIAASLRVAAPRGAPVRNPADAAEPQLVSVEITRDGDRAHCRVSIAAAGRCFAAEATELLLSDDAAIGLAARVTVAAVRASMAAAANVQFDGAEKSTVGGRPHVTVALHVWHDGRIRPLAGAAPISDTRESAAAHAALRALRELFH
jgi:hypothetical protein